MPSSSSASRPRLWYHGAQGQFSWSLLLPLAGLVWTAGPLVATHFSTSRLAAFSVITLAAVGTVFLTMVWGVVMVLGFFGPLVLESVEAASGDEVAIALAFEGIKLLAGAVVGLAIGIGVRSRAISEPSAM